MLTLPQVQDLGRIVGDHMLALQIELFGAGTVDPLLMQQLIGRGILDPSAGAQVDLVQQSAEIGAALQRLAGLGTDATGWSLERFRAYIAADPAPLSEVELRSIEAIRTDGAHRCAGLGNTIGSACGQVAIDADRELEARSMGVIRDELEAGSRRRDTARGIKSRIGEALHDHSRDLSRIVNTELEDAHLAGSAGQAERLFGGGAIVARVPAPDACPTCNRLFLRGGVPRLFRLDALRANGTNRGRSRADFQPVAGTVHPLCHCAFVTVPRGFRIAEGARLERVPQGAQIEELGGGEIRYAA